MRVKRYVVDSMPDALEKIRVDLGKDAIILNTKPIKTGGFLGLFRKQQIEVIAAAETKDSARERAAAAREEKQPLAAFSAPAAKQAYQRSLEPAAAKVREGASAVAVQTPPPPVAPAQSAGAASALATKPGRPLAVDESRRTDTLSPRLADELRDMREMLQKLLLQKELNDNLPPALSAVRERLVAQEVESGIVADILQQLLRTLDEPKRQSEREVWETASDVIRGMLAKGANRPPRIGRHVRYAFFFGPTGVGKTTTIAKLAAEAMLKEKRKVGFITSDTYRIAAVEQLRTYANILNVPLEVVFSPGEVEQAMERLHDCDLVLVDTAGRNYRNDEYVKSMKEFLRFGETSENYLVLSLTTKYADMKAIVTNFQDVPIDKVIFTKSDETQAYGAILNIVHQFDLSLSYITTGQNVPDDIIVATPEQVTTLLVGDDTYA